MIGSRKMRYVSLALLAAIAVAGVPAAGTEEAATREGETMKRLTPVLFVDRIEPCLEFWVDRLGFTKEAEVAEGEHLGFVSLKKGGIEVMYQTRQSLVADLPAVAANVKDPTTFLYVEVEDLDAVKESLQGVAEVVLPERKTFYGAREVVFLEPGGHYVTFAQFAPPAE
jgi:uncharacterized glyoxalase superfamily protein PhnB